MPALSSSPSGAIALQVPPTGGWYIYPLTVFEMEEHKRQGLYYNYDEKFSRFHT